MSMDILNFLNQLIDSMTVMQITAIVVSLSGILVTTGIYRSNQRKDNKIALSKETNVLKSQLSDVVHLMDKFIMLEKDALNASEGMTLDKRNQSEATKDKIINIESSIETFANNYPEHFDALKLIKVPLHEIGCAFDDGNDYGLERLEENVLEVKKRYQEFYDNN